MVLTEKTGLALTSSVTSLLLMKPVLRLSLHPSRLARKKEMHISLLTSDGSGASMVSCGLTRVSSVAKKATRVTRVILALLASMGLTPPYPDRRESKESKV
jgi:hypothetical protein